MKPFLTNKGDFHKQITIIEGDQIISKDFQVAEKLSTLSPRKQAHGRAGGFFNFFTFSKVKFAHSTSPWA